jgi:Tfp pilus assembly protein PilF
MRFLAPVLIAGVAAALATTSAVGQRPDDQILPRSIELLKQGNAHLAAGKFIEADEAFETALAVDPRNRAAYIALARVAQRERLFGQSIRYAKKALVLEPNDLCPSGCAQLAELSATITRGPTVAAAKPPATPKSN